MPTLTKINGSIVWNDRTVLALISECRIAGQIAARSKLAELESRGPVFNVVENANDGSVFHDPSKPSVIVGQLLDVCGFANVHLLKANGSFYRLAKKLSETNTYRFRCSKHYYGGGSLHIYDMTNRQGMSVNEAAHTAVASKLKEYGIDAYMESRID